MSTTAPRSSSLLSAGNYKRPPPRSPSPLSPSLVSPRPSSKSAARHETLDPTPRRAGPTPAAWIRRKAGSRWRSASFPRDGGGASRQPGLHVTVELCQGVAAEALVSDQLCLFDLLTGS
ncbi:unnamed protein product [Urochloa humidicola]